MPASPPPPPSNIRAFVHYKESTIYAGEEIECIVTFRNIGSLKSAEVETENDLRTPNSNGFPRVRTRSVNASTALPSRRGSVAQSKPPLSRTPSVASTRVASHTQGHRPTLSLNVIPASARGGLNSAPLPLRSPNITGKPSGLHERSLSIISMGSDVAVEGRTTVAGPAERRSGKGHGRSASMQSASKRPPIYSSPSLGAYIGW